MHHLACLGRLLGRLEDYGIAQFLGGSLGVVKVLESLRELPTGIGTLAMARRRARRRAAQGSIRGRLLASSAVGPGRGSDMKP